MERDAFHVSYVSDEIPEAVFHGQAVKTVAYLRVSTAQQDVRSQRLAILEYARKHDFRIDDFIEATASGQASEKRRRLDELMNVLQRGDRLVVSELSRLGRSLGQIVAILDALAKAGVAFVAMKENIRVDGKRDIQTKVMTTLFALFAEVERNLISERTREGLAKARSSGRKLGRPKGSLGVSRFNGKEDDIRRFLELGVSKTAIAKLTGVSRLPYDPLQLHEDPRAQAEPLACISAPIWSVPSIPAAGSRSVTCPTSRITRKQRIVQPVARPSRHNIYSRIRRARHALLTRYAKATCSAINATRRAMKSSQSNAETVVSTTRPPSITLGGNNPPSSQIRAARWRVNVMRNARVGPARVSVNSALNRLINATSLPRLERLRVQGRGVSTRSQPLSEALLTHTPPLPKNAPVRRDFTSLIP